MFPTIPVLCSYKTKQPEHKTDELLSMQKHYKPIIYYDMQKTTQKLNMASILTCIISDYCNINEVSLVRLYGSKTCGTIYSPYAYCV